MDRELMEELGLMATEAQLGYINNMLYDLGCDLSDYTDTAEADLTKEEASSLIDEIKDDWGFMKND